MAFFGALEQLLADLYPYRVPLSAAAAVVALLAIAFAVRRGWHQVARRWIMARPVRSAVLAVILLVVLIPTANYLLSPLWERSTLYEGNPLEVAATGTTGEAATAAAAVASPAPTANTVATANVETATSSPTAPAQAGATAATPRLVSQGEFRGADEFHFGSGLAQVIEIEPGQYLLRLEEFSVRNGPDLYVYLSSVEERPSEDGVQLGKLKATDGSFNYEIPPGTEIEMLGYAMIWCEPFGVLFAVSPLN